MTFAEASAIERTGDDSFRAEVHNGWDIAGNANGGYLLAIAARDGLVIREIPVRWHHEEDTRVRVLRDVIGSFLELLAIRRRLGRIPKANP